MLLNLRVPVECHTVQRPAVSDQLGTVGGGDGPAEDRATKQDVARRRVQRQCLAGVVQRAVQADRAAVMQQRSQVVDRTREVGRPRVRGDGAGVGPRSIHRQRVVCRDRHSSVIGPIAAEVQRAAVGFEGSVVRPDRRVDGDGTAAVGTDGSIVDDLAGGGVATDLPAETSDRDVGADRQDGIRRGEEDSAVIGEGDLAGPRQRLRVGEDQRGAAAAPQQLQLTVERQAVPHRQRIVLLNLRVPAECHAIERARRDND